jgi:hypothetical protein
MKLAEDTASAAALPGLAAIHYTPEYVFFE